jgi:cell division protein FtsW (lipid II flippase)
MGIATDLGEFLTVIFAIAIVGFFAYVTESIFLILLLVLIIGFVIFRAIKKRRNY